jgi:GNAT superfamily N-acetyltransferase
MMKTVPNFIVRNTKAEDYESIKQLCLKVYPYTKPWTQEQVLSHIQIFPEGQFVIEEVNSKTIVGMCSSLVVRWDDYDNSGSWSVFTDKGLFTNHDPNSGRTLYGAEIMVDPDYQGQGLGRKLYKARRELVTRMKLLRIRAGARVRGYSNYANTYSPQEYLKKVNDKVIFDPTLSFQLKEDFKFIALVDNYLLNDPESLGYAVIIEWLNPDIATESNIQNQLMMQERIFKSN